MFVLFFFDIFTNPCGVIVVFFEIGCWVAYFQLLKKIRYCSTPVIYVSLYSVGSKALGNIFAIVASVS